jgi:malate dehydrogenase (oxaloacetate-decarboxylating)
MSDVYSESVELHRKNKGKLETKSKVSVGNRQELSLAYSPGVAGVCREIAADKNKSFELTFRGNAVAVISDGSAILGLGNLGAEAALPVMEGKAILFKEFGGVDAFPICLATQDTEEIIKAVKFLAPNFAGINLEDISAPRCFEIEERLKAELDIPVMHDDQHGTAVVVLAGLINALKLRGSSKENIKAVINGAGAAGIATCKLLLRYGFRDIVMCDSTGVIYEGRIEGMNPVKEEMARITNQAGKKGTLADAVKGADVFIGMSAPDVLKAEMIRTMNEKPVIFALANPVPEIMPDSAKEAGAYIMASGRSDFPNQVNNVLAFPGIFRGALDHRVRQITDDMLIRAAEAIAESVENPTPDNIIPDPFDGNVPKKVAEAIR